MSRVRGLWRSFQSDADDNSTTGAVNQECQNCHAGVTRAFVRVFAEKNTEGVYACPNCTTQAAISAGACRPPAGGVGGDPR